MRIPSTTNRDPVTFNMTPMIDIVFLLIIFFLVSSHLARRENRIQLELPDALSGQEPIVTNRPRLTVNIREDGEVLIGGKSVDPGQLNQVLRAFANKNVVDPELRIRSDRRATYERVQPIMKTAADVGIWDVTFAVLAEK